MSALRGYERKEEERKRNRKPKFRHAIDTSDQRAKKKLLENTTWFKNNKGKDKGRQKEKGRRKEKERWCHENEKLSYSP